MSLFRLPRLFTRLRSRKWSARQVRLAARLPPLPAPGPVPVQKDLPQPRSGFVL